MSGLSIRPFAPGDAAKLRAVFESSVHGLACRDYTLAQCMAWAPALDPQQCLHWCDSMAHLSPYVVRRDGRIVAYADLQNDGLIDHFFVAASAAGCGVGRRLLAFLLEEAQRRGLARVYADVSLRAEALFAHQGFVVMQRRLVLKRGEQFANAHMVWQSPCARQDKAPLLR
ncbi:GNAT family N-acetyltransferase [Craterilacuibacter sinensis]|nr:GNAT family N-acetyltransferase [Craterilacuibacter sinensis]